MRDNDEVRSDAVALFSTGPVRLRPGPVPLHHQVYRHLLRAMDEGLLRPGDRLPGERLLCGLYGCSMITVRRALDELTRERRIVRERGRGTFVIDPPLDRELDLLGSFSIEMRQRGLDPTTRLLAIAEVPAPAQVAGALRLSVRTPCYRIERLRLVGGRPLLLEEVHLPASRFPGLFSADLERGSLYEVMAERYDIRLDFGEEIVEAVALSSREAELLSQRKGAPALLMLLVAFDQHDYPVEHCRSVIRGDRARFHVSAHRADAKLRVVAD